MRVNISINDKLLKELDRQAQEADRNRSAHIRELIKKESKK